MSRRPRLQIKPNVVPKSASQSKISDEDSRCKPVDEFDKNKLDDAHSNDENNILLTKQQSSPAKGEIIVLTNRPLEASSNLENEATTSSNVSNTTHTDQNDSQKDSENSDKNQELSANNQESKVKRRPRIVVKPNLASKSLTLLTKPKSNATDVKSIFPATVKNQGSLPVSPIYDQLSPTFKSYSDHLINQSPSTKTINDSQAIHTDNSINSFNENLNNLSTINNESTSQHNAIVDNSVTHGQTGGEGKVGGPEGTIDLNLNEIISLEVQTKTTNQFECFEDTNNNNTNNTYTQDTNDITDHNTTTTSTANHTTTTASNHPITSTSSKNTTDIISTNNINNSHLTPKHSASMSHVPTSKLNDGEGAGMDGGSEGGMEGVVKTMSCQQLHERLVNKKAKERQKSRLTQPLHEPVDTSVVCMKDLIYKNPVNNPMKYRLLEMKKKKKRKGAAASDDDDDNVSDTSSVVSGATNSSMSTNRSNKNNNGDKDIKSKNGDIKNKNGAGDEEDLAVPQIEIGADGKIIINEKSLEVMDESDGEMEVVNETDAKVSGYPRKNRTKTWGINETKKFYAALSMIGTDFSLMTQVFSNRCRQDLKRKFMREDKLNRFLVDAALKERRALDITLLAEPVVEDVPGKNKNKKSKLKSEKVLEAADATCDAEKLGGATTTTSSSSNTITDVATAVTEAGGKKKRVGTGRVGRPKKKFTLYEDSSDDGGDHSKTTAADDASDVASVATTLDDDHLSDVEIVDFIRKRRTKSGRVVKPPLVMERVTSVLIGSCPLKDAATTTLKKGSSKRKQQLHQMKQDTRQTAIKGVLSNFDVVSVDDNESNFDTASVAESVVMENNVVRKEDGDGVKKEKDVEREKEEDERREEGGEGLAHSFEQLNSNLNVVDHTNIDLSALGIDHIPPHHRLVIVSQNNNNNSNNRNNDDDNSSQQQQQQEMHVFVVPDATLATVLQTTRQSGKDAVELLFSLIQAPDTTCNGASSEVTT